MTFEYNPKGVCSQHFTFEIDDNDIIKSLVVIGGCKGNLAGISKLVVGMSVDEVINRLQGTLCRPTTSCPDQIAQALIQYKTSKQ